MLVIYNTRLGSIDVQERNLLFKGFFSLIDVSLKIRKEWFSWKLLVLLISSKDFKPKSLATIYLTLPNCLEKESGYSKASLVWMMLVKYNTSLGSIDCSRKELVILRLV